MRNVLMNTIKLQIEGLKGLDFHLFMDELFIKKYGINYTPIKQKRDRGCDGILNNDTILAIYAPEQHDLKKFKKKTKDDYESYKINLSQKYPKWAVIYNGEWTTRMIDFIIELRKDSITIGIKQILEIIKGFPWSKLKEIAGYLKVDPQYINNDMIVNVVEDLVRYSDEENFKTNSGMRRESPYYIEDKIRLNFHENEICEAIEEYTEYLEYFKLVRSTIKGFKEYEIGALRNRIKEDYKKFRERFNNNQSFKSILEFMTEQYSQKSENDDTYLFYVRIVLVYFFEQCLIGIKTGVS
jgi:hypothetical protein